MKNPTLPFLFLASLFLFTSCEKETIDMHSTQNAAKLSLVNAAEVIVFQYSQFDLNSFERTGFVIDKYGNLKTYHLSAEESAKLPKSGQWSEQDANFLYYKATSSATKVGEETMLLFYNKIKLAVSGTLTEKVNDTTQPLAESFHAFRAHTPPSGYGSCAANTSSCGSGSSYSTTVHTPYLLSSEGAVQQENLHTAAIEIVQWMKGMKVEAGL